MTAAISLEELGYLIQGDGDALPFQYAVAGDAWLAEAWATADDPQYLLHVGWYASRSEARWITGAYYDHATATQAADVPRVTDESWCHLVRDRVPCPRIDALHAVMRAATRGEDEPDEPDALSSDVLSAARDRLVVWSCWRHRPPIEAAWACGLVDLMRDAQRFYAASRTPRGVGLAVELWTMHVAAGVYSRTHRGGAWMPGLDAAARADLNDAMRRRYADLVEAMFPADVARAVMAEGSPARTPRMAALESPEKDGP